jgi:hypothetical protein
MEGAILATDALPTWPQGFVDLHGSVAAAARRRGARDLPDARWIMSLSSTGGEIERYDLQKRLCSDAPPLNCM